MNPQMLVPIKPKPEHFLNKTYVFQVTSLNVTLTSLENTYDKNVVLLTRRRYLEVQLQLEECERRYQEIFNPNIGERTQADSCSESQTPHPPQQANLHLFVPSQVLARTQASSGSASPR